jgi:hypothetical protein
VPVKVVSEMLDHGSVTITYDTYSHVIPGMAEDATTEWRGLCSERGSCHRLVFWRPRRKHLEEGRAPPCVKLDGSPTEQHALRDLTEMVPHVKPSVWLQSSFGGRPGRVAGHHVRVAPTVIFMRSCVVSDLEPGVSETSEQMRVDVDPSCLAPALNLL